MVMGFFSGFIIYRLARRDETSRKDFLKNAQKILYANYVACFLGIVSNLLITATDPELIASRYSRLLGLMAVFPIVYFVNRTLYKLFSSKASHPNG